MTKTRETQEDSADYITTDTILQRIASLRVPDLTGPEKNAVKRLYADVKRKNKEERGEDSPPHSSRVASRL